MKPAYHDYWAKTGLDGYFTLSHDTAWAWPPITAVYYLKGNILKPLSGVLPPRTAA